MRVLSLLLSIPACGAAQCSPPGEELGRGVSKCVYDPDGPIRIYHGEVENGKISMAIGCDGNEEQYCSLGFGKGMSSNTGESSIAIFTTESDAFTVSGSSIGAKKDNFISNSKIQEVGGTKFILFDVAVEKLEGSEDKADFIYAIGKLASGKPGYHAIGKGKFCFNFKNSHYSEGECTDGPLGPEIEEPKSEEPKSEEPKIEEPVSQVNCGGGREAETCDKCISDSSGELGKKFCGGDCEWKNNQCSDRSKSDVNCGGHRAADCAKCPEEGQGEGYCNGECQWKNGSCIIKSTKIEEPESAEPESAEPESAEPEIEETAYYAENTEVRECPPGSEITNQEECIKAAKSLNIAISNPEPLVGIYDIIPRYCSYRPKSVGVYKVETHVLHFNKNDVGEKRFDLAPICKVPDTCKDVQSDCEDYKLSCTAPKYKEWAKNKCAKTCKACNKADPCRDTNSDCSKYRSFCNEIKYISWANYQCAKTCFC